MGAIIRDWSAEAAKQVADQSLDFVYIDANHSCAACLLDLRSWHPKVRKGGYLSGHDYDFPGVKEAVDIFRGETLLRLSFLTNDHDTSYAIRIP